MAQRLVVWNADDEKPRFMPSLGRKVIQLSLAYEELSEIYPELAEAIGKGRVISHNVYLFGYGTVFTFVVEDDREERIVRN
jgi:hypothetical protein